MEYLNRKQIIPKLRRWTLGATVDLGLLSASNLFLVLCLSKFSIYSLLSLVDLFIDLDALFLFFLYVHIYILSV